MGTCSSVRQWQPGQRRSGLRKRGAEAGTGPSSRGRVQGLHLGSPWFGSGSGHLTWGCGEPGDYSGRRGGTGRSRRGREGRDGRRGRGEGRRSHLTGLCSVGTCSGLSWDSGAAARPGESPASSGNLRPCGVSWALMSRPRGVLRGEWRSGRQAYPQLRLSPEPLLTCGRPRPVPG